MDGDALDELVVLLQAIERRAAWPSHILMNIIVLMGKPGGGIEADRLDAHVVQDMD